MERRGLLMLTLLGGLGVGTLLLVRGEAGGPGHAVGPAGAPLAPAPLEEERAFVRDLLELSERRYRSPRRRLTLVRVALAPVSSAGLALDDARPAWSGPELPAAEVERLALAAIDPRGLCAPVTVQRRVLRHPETGAWRSFEQVEAQVHDDDPARAPGSPPARVVRACVDPLTREVWVEDERRPFRAGIGSGPPSPRGPLVAIQPDVAPLGSSLTLRGPDGPAAERGGLEPRDALELALAAIDPVAGLVGTPDEPRRVVRRHPLSGEWRAYEYVRVIVPSRDPLDLACGRVGDEIEAWVDAETREVWVEDADREP